MKKQTIAPAQQAGFSTLEMWLNSENKLFTKFFADKGESITNKKMLLDMQLMRCCSICSLCFPLLFF